MFIYQPYLLKRLFWSNLKFVTYISVWLAMLGLISHKIWGIENILNMEFVRVVIENLPQVQLNDINGLLLQTLFLTGIFIFFIISLNSFHLFVRDSYNYIKNSHILDDPKIRVNLIIDAINLNLEDVYFLEELRTDYFRLACRKKDSANKSLTVFEGSIISIQYYISKLVRELFDNNRKIILDYNKKCLELCNIRHFNLVKHKHFP